MWCYTSNLMDSCATRCYLPHQDIQEEIIIIIDLSSAWSALSFPELICNGLSLCFRTPLRVHPPLPGGLPDKASHNAKHYSLLDWSASMSCLCFSVLSNYWIVFVLSVSICMCCFCLLIFVVVYLCRLTAFVPAIWLWNMSVFHSVHHIFQIPCALNCTQIPISWLANSHSWFNSRKSGQGKLTWLATMAAAGNGRLWIRFHIGTIQKGSRM